MNPLSFESMKWALAFLCRSQAAYFTKRDCRRNGLSYREISGKKKSRRHPRHDRVGSKSKPRHHRHYKRAA